MNDSTLLLDIWKQISQISADVKALRSDVGDAFSLLKRAALLIALGTAAIGSHVSNDKMAGMIAVVLKRLTE